MKAKVMSKDAFKSPKCLLDEEGGYANEATNPRLVFCKKKETELTVLLCAICGNFSLLFFQDKYGTPLNVHFPMKLYESHLTHPPLSQFPEFWVKK